MPLLSIGLYGSQHGADVSILTASLSLRPTRIGFLVKPSDRAAVRRVMRICSCLWGGVFNPIIPVTKSLPVPWRDRHGFRLSPMRVSAGYVRFFEPDVFVEASVGRGDVLGLPDQKIGMTTSRVLSIDEFLKSPRRDGGPALGLDVVDLYQELYESEFQFVSRHKRRVALFSGSSTASAFIEAAFGAFPRDGVLGHVSRAYSSAFQPVKMPISAAGCRETLSSRALTPLDFTSYGTSKRSDYWHDPMIFIVDPEST